MEEHCRISSQLKCKICNMASSLELSSWLATRSDGAVKVEVLDSRC